jgi:hypothetical protein
MPERGNQIRNIRLEAIMDVTKSVAFIEEKGSDLEKARMTNSLPRPQERLGQQTGDAPRGW